MMRLIETKVIGAGLAPSCPSNEKSERLVRIIVTVDNTGKIRISNQGNSFFAGKDYPGVIIRA